MMTAARITPHVSAARLASVALAAVLFFSACFGASEQQVGMDYLNYDRMSRASTDRTEAPDCSRGGGDGTRTHGLFDATEAL